ncbi:MAG: VCBS repeat-containing protein, partial [Deltaproteobacteria bacterium]|nr:VCBS repeat-containing protein [Deltaproteobacteria bacterium]
MSSESPRRIYFFFLLGSLVLTGLVAAERAEASITCSDSNQRCDLVDEGSVTLGWTASSSAVDHYAVEISWNGGSYQLHSSWADIPASQRSVTVDSAVGHSFRIRTLACDASNSCSAPSSSSYRIAFYESAEDPTPEPEPTPPPEEPEPTPPAEEPSYNNGDSEFYLSRWITQTGGYGANEPWIAGDYNGDGRTDIANAYSDGGSTSINIYRSTGKAFYIRNWADRQGKFSTSKRWLAGDFSGDGRDDLAEVFKNNGSASIDVRVSTGESFKLQRWASQKGGFSSSDQWIVGNFNADKRDDIARIFDDNGKASID